MRKCGDAEMRESEGHNVESRKVKCQNVPGGPASHFHYSIFPLFLFLEDDKGINALSVSSRGYNKPAGLFLSVMTS
jgi:hypothetical protein